MNKKKLIETIKDSTEAEAIKALDKYTSEYTALVLLRLLDETKKQ
tara:strand:- start:177 stop:311 length:135 start_codon:yes stop_codon:yes gene_type:complete